ncbi:MAG: hypothetical protein ACLU4N_12160 [Butyricimonas faecihominis]
MGSRVNQNRSKLVYLGKGFATNKGWIFNFGFDYLDAEIDPRNNLENYKRLSATTHVARVWKTNARSLSWDLDLDYGQSIDDEKSDPDISYKDRQIQIQLSPMSVSNRLNWVFTQSGTGNTSTNRRRGLLAQQNQTD